MFFIEWTCQKTRNRLIVAPSRRSAIETFKAVDERYSGMLKYDGNPKVLRCWEGSRIPTPNALLNALNVERHEKEYRMWVGGLMHRFPNFIDTDDRDSRVEFVSKWPYFQLCPSCDGVENVGCQPCNYDGIVFKPEFNPRPYWDSQHQALDLLDENDDPKGSIWVASHGYMWMTINQYSLDQDAPEGMKSLRDLYGLSSEEISLCFTGDQVEIPQEITDYLSERDLKIDAEERADGKRREQRRKEISEEEQRERAKAEVLLWKVSEFNLQSVVP